ncbi:MAG: helix-turn-helix domain-containing protein [bacterium]
MDEIKENITRNIQHFRKKMNISQEELSSLCGYSSTYIGKIERGQRSPSLDTLIRIARSLQIPITSFFDSFYRRQDQLKENWDPKKFSPYDLATRRFNYLVGELTGSGHVENLFKLPWFQTENLPADKLGNNKLWELSFINFSPSLIEALQTFIDSGDKDDKKHFSLKLSGYQFQWEPVDLVLIFAEQDKIKLELFYPRIVRDGDSLPLEELNFDLAE